MKLIAAMLKLAARNVLLLAALCALGYVSFQHVKLYRAMNLEQAASRAALEATARELGATVGQLESQTALVKSLTEREAQLLAKLQAASPGSRVDSKTITVVEYRDRVQFVEREGVWEDPHGRFRLTLPAGTFDRQQLFQYTALVVRSKDGKSRIQDQQFLELDPRTRQPIPGDAPKLETSFRFASERESRGVLGARLVAGIDAGSNPVAGVQLLDLSVLGSPVIRDLSLSALGGWDSEDRDPFVAAHLGYRLLGSNVSLGPYFGASGSGRTRAGLAVTIEITR